MENYEPDSSSYSYYEEELKNIRSRLSRTYSAIIHDAQNLHITVYAYYSPFAVVFETPGALGHREEERRFLANFKTKVAKEVVKYKKRLKQLEEDAAKYGYKVR